MIYCPTCFQENQTTEAPCSACQSSLILRGRYQLQKRLGKGGSSQVFLAFDRVENAERAIKILQNAADWKGVEHFERQLSILQSLSHYGVPKIYEQFSEGSQSRLTFYSVQELVEGESLATRIKRGHRYNEESARRLLSQIVEILSYLHSLSPPVLHRDIKPQNVMIRPDETPVLIDFDTARGAAIDKERADGTMVGTAGFVPMEQLAGQAAPASDFYSLGMTIVAALSHKDVVEFPVERSRVKFEGFLSVSSGLQKILRKMTEPAIEDRYQDARSLQQALDGRSPQAARMAAPPPKKEEKTALPKEERKRHLRSQQGGIKSWHVLVGVALVVVAFLSLRDSPSAPTSETPVVSFPLPEAFGESKATLEEYQPWPSDFIKEGVFWVAEVTDFSSQWGTSGWTAAQVTGAPNVFPAYGTNQKAWAPKETSAGYEWVSVTFPAVEAKAITVFETSYAGSIIRIDDLSEPGAPEVLWEGPVTQYISKGRAFRVRLNSPRIISALRVILDTRANSSWSEIDAIGLIPKNPPTAEQLAELRKIKDEQAKAAREASKLPGGDEALAQLVKRNVLWAVSAEASSAYSTGDLGSDDWAASRATGAPDVFPYCVDDKNAWAPKEQDAGSESITLSFPETVSSGVIIVENSLPGSVMQIEEVSNPAQAVVLWSGSPTKPTQNCRIVEIPIVVRKIKTLRLSLDTKNQKGWEEIDAVGLIPN